MLQLWRYDVKDFQKHCFFIYLFIYCIFLHENKTKSHDFNGFRKVRERATAIVPWENCPKKESVHPKREIDIDRLQKIADILQIVTYRDYKKSDRGSKAY